MLSVYSDEVKRFLEKEKYYNPHKLFDGLTVLSNFNYYGSSLNNDTAYKLLSPISNKMNVLLSHFSPKERVTADVRHFFNKIKLTKNYFDINEIDKVKNSLYGINQVFGNKLYNSSLIVDITPSNLNGTLQFNINILKDNGIDISELLYSNNANFAHNKNKIANFSVTENEFKKINEFLMNLSNYKNIPEAFNNSNIISIGKNNNYPITINHLWIAKHEHDTNGKNLIYFKSHDSAFEFWQNNQDKKYKIIRNDVNITNRDWELIKNKEKYLNIINSDVLTEKKASKEYYIEIFNPAMKNKTKYDLFKDLAKVNKNVLIEELVKNYPNSDYSEFVNMDNKSIIRSIVEGRLTNKNWIFPDESLINASKTKAFKSLFSAVETNNNLKELFSKTKIIDNENNTIDPYTISKVNSYNQIITDIKKNICNSLLHGDSVLLMAREGVDYCINTATKQPFENIQQLYISQVRYDNGFKSPYFMPSQDVINNGFDIIPKNLSTILSSLNKQKIEIEFTSFFNADQIKNNSNTLELATSLLNTELKTPYMKDNVDTLPEPKYYEPKSISISENFSRHMSEYFDSIYTGRYYKPPNYNKKELENLINYINKHNSSFFHDAQNAYTIVKNNLLNNANQRKRDHSRKRS